MKQMKILAISHACVVDEYRSKFEMMTNDQNIDLKLMVPERSIEGFPVINPVPVISKSYSIVKEQTFFSKKIYMHFYPFLPFSFFRDNFDLIYIEEEPWSLAATEIIFLNQLNKNKVPVVFFTWQNLINPWKSSSLKKIFYRHIEQITLSKFNAAIAGSVEAAHVLRKKRFKGLIRVIPQFGIDPNRFQRLPVQNMADKLILKKPVIGFIGRLIPEKGIFILLEAFRKIKQECSLLVIGNGASAVDFKRYISKHGLGNKIHWIPSV
ncbi:MAG: hypothetical protein A2161_08225, partial [Candidatus Schekmanbacteria bacterium RBG_13_48_7]